MPDLFRVSEAQVANLLYHWRGRVWRGAQTSGVLISRDEPPYDQLVYWTSRGLLDSQDRGAAPPLELDTREAQVRDHLRRNLPRDYAWLFSAEESGILSPTWAAACWWCAACRHAARLRPLLGAAPRPCVTNATAASGHFAGADYRWRRDSPFEAGSSGFGFEHGWAHGDDHGPELGDEAVERICACGLRAGYAVIWSHGRLVLPMPNGPLMIDLVGREVRDGDA